LPVYEHIVILTGGGISAEAGISMVCDGDGIRPHAGIADTAAAAAFARDPAYVLDYYNGRRRLLGQSAPNSAHDALARLEMEHKGSVWVVTHNTDTLHETAGTRNLIHMYGQLNQMLCNHCGTRRPWGAGRPDLTADTACLTCNRQGGLRPDVVWCGETPYEMDRICALVELCDVFVTIGTRRDFHPARDFVEMARRRGGYAIEIDDGPSAHSAMFHETIHGAPTVVVPEFVERLLMGQD
jgi:NAD-dependent deacetylase